MPVLGGVLLFQHQKRSTSTLETSCKSISTAHTGKGGGGALPQRASVVSEKISMETEKRILIENAKTTPNKTHEEEFMTLLNL